MKRYDTEYEARHAIADTALRYLGVKEGTKGHRDIIDAFNSVKPQPRAYSVKYTDAWCATFVTFIFDKLDMANLIERECGCQEMINKCKKRNLVDFAKKGSSFNVGNIVMYDWDSNGTSEHTGIIYKVESTNIYVVEGNKNDAVGMREIAKDSKLISCIITPHFEVCVKPKTNADGTPYDYDNLGWNKDKNGWWYAYGHKKGEYHSNTFAKIDKKWYAFNSDGYCVDCSNLVVTEKGEITSIGGKLI